MKRLTEIIVSLAVAASVAAAGFNYVAEAMHGIAAAATALGGH